MAVFKQTQIINQPVEKVFQTVIDVANFPKWNPTTMSARKISKGETKEGTFFELEIKGFGKTKEELQEFKKNKQVRLVPHIKMMAGGHRFIFTNLGSKTRINHELEMTPKGIFIFLAPFLWLTGQKNLNDTANSLKMYLEKT